MRRWSGPCAVSRQAFMRWRSGPCAASRQAFMRWRSGPCAASRQAFMRRWSGLARPPAGFRALAERAMRGQPAAICGCRRHHRHTGTLWRGNLIWSLPSLEQAARASPCWRSTSVWRWAPAPMPERTICARQRMHRGRMCIRRVAAGTCCRRTAPYRWFQQAGAAQAAAGRLRSRARERSRSM